MNTGQKIKAVRKSHGLTQKELGKLLGITASAVGQFETGLKPPKLETLERIAAALQVPIWYLFGDAQIPTDIALDQKLAQVGYSIGYCEDDAVLWINYPDGTLEVSAADLTELNDKADTYMRFLLQDLKARRIGSFRTLSKDVATSGNN